MSAEKAQPFDSFTAVYKILMWAGYYKLETTKSRLKLIFHQIYRPFAFLVIVIFNIQHILFIVTYSDNNLNDLFDSYAIEIPQVNLLVKYLSVNLQLSRIDKIHNLLKDPIFGADSEADNKLILKNNIKMQRVCRAVTMMCNFCVVFWALSHFMRRYQDPTAVVPSYVPFETDTWLKYTFSVFIESGPFLWVAHGHINLDVLIITHYAQGQAQLELIRNNMERLLDDKQRTDRRSQYKDEVDLGLKKEFVRYVERFDKVVWYMKEVDGVFNIAMSFQFFTSGATLCMVIAKIQDTPIATASFIWLLSFVLILLVQVFLYCFFGNLVKDESERLANSLYLSDWYTLSPKFRRILLITMMRWSRTVTPTVCGIIPISFTTFISILRSTYSLCALLKIA